MSKVPKLLHVFPLVNAPKRSYVYIAKRGSHTAQFAQSALLSHWEYKVHLRLITATF